MSMATKRIAGEKGYLDDDDKIIRQYDKDGDGNFTLEEVKSMAKDFRVALTSKEMYRKLLIACGVLLVVSWAGNFGLTYATVALTAQLNAQDGDLTDKAGNIVATKPKGDSGEFFSGHGVENPIDLRRLAVGSHAFYGTISTTKSEMRGIFSDHTQGISTTITWADHTHAGDEDHVHDTTVAVANGGTESALVYLSSQFLDVADCDSYRDITVDAEEVSAETFKLDCCGEDTDLCDVYVEVAAGRRKLSCFSPLSTVVEKIKGKMLLKDLKFGDLILAANKVFQPFVFDHHAHNTKSSEFVQIHTDESDAIESSNPIELTKDHMIFVDGKDLPILAGDVEMGDSLIGLNGPTKVTKIKIVKRDGLFSPLTRDATLYVDGVLASSMVDANDLLGPSSSDANFLNFGFFKIHIHTFMSRAIAPLFHKLCSKVDSKHCETTVSDGEGGHRNMLMEAGIVILTLHPLIQGLLLFLLPAAGAVALFAYYALMGVAPVTLVMGLLLLAKKHSAKSKLA